MKIKIKKDDWRNTNLRETDYEKVKHLEGKLAIVKHKDNGSYGFGNIELDVGEYGIYVNVVS